MKYLFALLFVVALAFGGWYLYTHKPVVAVVPAPVSTGEKIYTTPNGYISFTYPETFTLDEMYRYLALGPGKEIGGVKVTIPASMATGTNLSLDSYLSIEASPATTTCSASLFLDRANAQATVEGNVTYSVASTTGAGAGNRYEETVYAFPGTNPCVAVRYFVHYGVLENYPAGTVRAFDRAALLKSFDTIRRTVRVQPQ